VLVRCTDEMVAPELRNDSLGLRAALSRVLVAEGRCCEGTSLVRFLHVAGLLPRRVRLLHC
jgi:hypothetical protein